MTPGMFKPPWQVFVWQCRHVGGMQRKGGEGERTHRDWCCEEGREVGNGREIPTSVIIKGMRCESLRNIDWQSLVFGLWRICFPPVLVRTGRRLPVQALGERGVLVSVTGYPRGGAPGPG